MRREGLELCWVIRDAARCRRNPAPISHHPWYDGVAMAMELETDGQRAAAAEPRPAAVLLLLCPGPDGTPHIPFLRRTETVARHRGQIALPGGARDPGDESLLATARREAWEELGIEPDAYDVVGALPEFDSAVSNF